MVPTIVRVVFIVSCLTFVSSANLGNIFSAARLFKRQTQPLRTLPLHQLPVVSRTFSSMFDTNGDGFISATEMQTALAAQGQIYSDEMIGMMIPHWDNDGDGTIDFSEFLAMQGWKEAETSGNDRNGQQNQNEQQNHPAYQTFEIIDLNRDGFITSTEMKAIMATTGNNTTDVLAVLAVVDTNGDGKIDFGEYKAMLQHGPQ